jgi:two-component system response regulator ParR
VEDDRRLAELVSDYLHEHGFAVQHVARGDLAGAACRQHAPELVVLDLMLPGLGASMCAGRSAASPMCRS